AFFLGLPRFIETRQAFSQLAEISPRVATGMSRAGGALKVAGGAVAAAIAPRAAMEGLSHLIPDVTLSGEELEAQLRRVGGIGGDVLSMFEDISRPWTRFGEPDYGIQDLEDFRRHLEAVANPNALQRAQKGLAD